MAGRRPLSPREERALVKYSRALPPRDRLLVTLQLFSGFRIHEVLSLTIGQVWRDGQVPPSFGVRPGLLKGKRGTTRWVPIVPELRRAIEAYMDERLPGGRRGFNADAHPLVLQEPLFLSRQHGPGKSVRGVCRSQGARIIKKAFARAHIFDDGRLGTHSLRKCYARKIYLLSGHDLLLTRDSLGHRSVAVTELYLDVNQEDLERIIRRGDWTRVPHSQRPYRLVPSKQSAGRCAAAGA